MARTSDSDEMSVRHAIASPPASRMPAATVSAPSPLRSATTTLAPSRAIVCALHVPMPDAAPVTIATLPSRRPIPDPHPLN